MPGYRIDRSTEIFEVRRFNGLPDDELLRRVSKRLRVGEKIQWGGG
jgi:hypothetical protein